MRREKTLLRKRRGWLRYYGHFGHRHTGRRAQVRPKRDYLRYPVWLSWAAKLKPAAVVCGCSLPLLSPILAGGRIPSAAALCGCFLPLLSPILAATWRMRLPQRPITLSLLNPNLTGSRILSVVAICSCSLPLLSPILAGGRIPLAKTLHYLNEGNQSKEENLF
jgi:hypothetical protein